MNREAFLKSLASKYPALAPQGLDTLVAPNLICPFKIQLPKLALQQAQEFISAAFNLRLNTEYQKYLAQNCQENLEHLQLRHAKNYGILMSYDFHWTPEGMKLIEINTNAAFLALADVLYAAWGLPHPVADFNIDEVKQNIEEEFFLASGKSKLSTAAIVDDKPSSQRLFIEFLVFEQLFKRWGLATKICDVHDVDSGIDVIYNRFTDFYFQSPESAKLKSLYNAGHCISPQPTEYFYLADKARLIQWSEVGFLEKYGAESMRTNLPGAWNLDSKTADDIWGRRKKLFIKPQQAFGSKQSYKGASISRKLFDELSTQKFIAQEYVQAPEYEFDGQKYKYDLRVYAYKGRAQSIVARVYQGQVTNLQTLNGGFAPVVLQ